MAKCWVSGLKSVLVGKFELVLAAGGAPEEICDGGLCVPAE